MDFTTPLISAGLLCIKCVQKRIRKKLKIVGDVCVQKLMCYRRLEGLKKKKKEKLGATTTLCLLHIIAVMFVI